MTACVVCPILAPSEKPREPTWLLACDRCREALRRDLSGLSDALASLSVLRGSGRAERVSGTPEPTVPIRLEVVDLQLAARIGSVGPHTRGVLGLDDDQVGELSVATMLDREVRDWIETLPGVGHRPDATVTAMTRWLGVWLDKACDDHPGIDEFAANLLDAVRAVRGAARTGPAGEKVGKCPSVLRDDSRCGCVLRADPYMNRITCPRCAVSWNRDTGGWLRLKGQQERISA